jgi:hypothetical protein
MQIINLELELPDDGPYVAEIYCNKKRMCNLKRIKVFNKHF